MDVRTDAEGYNIIRPFFKRAYKNVSKHNVLVAEVVLLQVSGVAVESKRCCGFKITRYLAYLQQLYPNC